MKTVENNNKNNNNDLNVNDNEGKVTNNTGNKSYRDELINNSNEKTKTRTPTRTIRSVLYRASCSRISQEKKSHRRKGTTS